MILFTLVALVSLIIGVAIGTAAAVAGIDRIMARMSNEELQALGGRVVELRRHKSA